MLKRVCRTLVILSMLAAPSAALAQAMFSLWVGSREEVVARMIVLADLKPGEVVTDLGAGDGRLVIGSALANPKVTGFGVDIDAKLVREATARAWLAGVHDRVKFHHQNVFDADLSRVNVIYMWLFPEMMRLLRNKIMLEARPGTRIVSQLFDMGDWKPDAVDSEQATVRMWVVPARIEGNWRWELALPGQKKSRFDAILDQTFQYADGVVRVGTVRRQIREFKLNGDQLTFVLQVPMSGQTGNQELEFSGRVKGDVIEGRAKWLRPVRGDSEAYTATEMPWRATRTTATTYFKPTGVDGPS
jgi:SAM-dependent methyltransferase